MIKQKRRFNGAFFIRIYLTILLFLVCFFTIFAYRFDVLRVMYPDNKKAFALSEERQAKVADKLFEHDLTIENIPVIQAEVKKLLPEYDFSIFTFGELTRKIQEEAGVGPDEEGMEYNPLQRYFYQSYRNAPNKMSSEYCTSFYINREEGGVEVDLFPRFTSFVTTYMQIDLLVSFVLASLFYLLMHLEKKYHYFKKAVRKAQKQLKWGIFHKLSLKMLMVNILAAMFAFGSFFFMYINRYAYFEFIDTIKYQNSSDDDYTSYVERVREKTKDLALNKANKKEVTELITEDVIQYSYIYDKRGIYYAGNRGSSLLETIMTRESIYDISAVLTPKISVYMMPFQNQTASMIIYSYPLVSYVVPYVTAIVLIAISLFLIPVLGFFNKKVKEIRFIQEDVLFLANGNLDHEITTYGKDEIAQLGDNLNKMRLMLNENIQNEELSRKNNSELITSMSHDLRTPLTSIKAYLEVLKYRKYKDEEQYEKCLDRSIKKAEEIKEMTDAMFEYSLVFEPDHQAHMEDTTLEDILPLLIDQMEQLEMSKYEVDYQSGEETCRLEIDVQMLKRVFNNIFSNIQKYANPSLSIIIHVDCDEKQLKMVFSNGKKENLEKVERNHIGLKSTEKMMNLMNGRLVSQAQDERFTITLWFPVK